jgi:hypothetical protein
MIFRMFRSLILACFFVATGVVAQQQKTPATPSSQAIENSREPLDGDWRGSSICLVKPSACRDEEALYQIAKVEPLRYSLKADKIVDGKPVEMGSADCHFDQSSQALHCEFPKGYLDLTLTDDRLEGAMFLPDKTRWREIKLRKTPGRENRS